MLILVFVYKFRVLNRKLKFNFWIIGDNLGINFIFLIFIFNV